MIIKTRRLAVVALMMSLSSPVLAQSADIDMTAITAAIEAECAKSAEACELAVSAAIERLSSAGIVGDALNSELGVIGVAALTGSVALPPAEKLKLAATFTVISTASTNPSQKVAFAEAAVSFEAGTSVDPVAVSSTLSPN